MIYRKGSLLEVTEGIIIHGCNAQGVMGSGVAKQIKSTYPDVFLDYTYFYKVYPLGSIIFTKISNTLTIGSALTQKYYGPIRSQRYVSYDAIDLVFETLKKKLLNEQVNIPKIGAGLGGGSWKVIEEIINQHLPETICWEP